MSSSDAGKGKKGASQEGIRSDIPVKIKNKKLTNRLYPTYNTPLVKLANVNLLIQYTNAFANTYPALAPAVQKARHCQW